jgi:hypothetical protein
VNDRTSLIGWFSFGLVGLFLQPPPPSATQNFYLWFFLGEDYKGIGGWVYFFLLAVAAVVWVLYDSSNRRLPALGWRMGIVLAACLLIPTILYRFTVPNLSALDIPLDASSQEIAEVLSTFSPLAIYTEAIFYLGILGGILPLVLAIGYYVTYQGLAGCPQGLHGAYDAVFGECPECARLAAPPAPMPSPPGGRDYRPAPSQESSYAPPPPSKRKVQAWLVASSGKSYQLYEKESTIGRSSANDIYLTGDTTIGRQHAKIVEDRGRFRLIDLGAKNFTRVNGRIVREPVLLEPDDEIQFGENTTLSFVTKSR